MVVCPQCLHANPDGSVQCQVCHLTLSGHRSCPNCSVAVPTFAKFCYQCGVSLKLTEPQAPLPRTGTPQVATSANVQPQDGGFSQGYTSTVRLLHSQTSSFLALPTRLTIVDIGKSSKTTIPHVDVKHLPNSQIVSRNHARLLLEGKQYFIEDLGSTNGTYINNVQLPCGQRHQLRFGDRISFGNGDRFTLVFVRDQPLSLSYLKQISGQDIALEKELLQSYLEYAQISLQTLEAALLGQQMEKVEQTAEQLRIASANVGAQVMELLAEQLITKARGKAMAYAANLIVELEKALESVSSFVTAYD